MDLICAMDQLVRESGPIPCFPQDAAMRAELSARIIISQSPGLVEIQHVGSKGLSGAVENSPLQVGGAFPVFVEEDVAFPLPPSEVALPGSPPLVSLCGLLGGWTARVDDPSPPIFIVNAK